MSRSNVSAPPLIPGIRCAAASRIIFHIWLSPFRAALAFRPDVILAMTDPPVAGIAGAFIARLAGRPFVYNIRDMYPDMAVGGDIVRTKQMGRRAGNECIAAP